jgi:hypothetical protein
VAYIGNPPTVGQWRKLDDISGSFNGSTTTFTTSVGGSNVTAGSANQLFVSLGGVIQQPNVDYSVTTNSIIFTTAPGSGLDFFAVLAGDALNAAVPGDGTITTAKLAGNLTVDLDSGSASAPSLTFDPNTGIYSPGEDEVAVSTGGTGRLFVDSTGRVGIGTTSPSEKLHVSGAGTQVIRVEETGSSVVGKLFATTSKVGVSAQSNHALSFETNNDEKARIDTSGRLLVGTSTARSNIARYGADYTPATQIQTNETSGWGTGLSLVNYSASGYAPVLTFGLSGSNTAGTNTLVASGDRMGVITFNGNDGTNFEEGARIEAQVDGTPGANDMPGRLVFSTTADGASSPTERMRITSGGNVGIGTTPNSDSRLHVKSGANDSNPVLRLEAATNNFLNFRQTGTVYDIHVTAGDPLSFTIGASERVRIDSSGRLLVGTSTSPTGGDAQYSKLVVKGYVGDNTGYAPIALMAGTNGASLANGNGIGRIEFCAADSASFAQITALVDGTTGSNDYPGRLVFSTTADGASSPTERMRILSNGATKISTDGTYYATSQTHEMRTADNNWIAYFTNKHPSAPYGIFRSNGGLANYSANNANLSDRNVKKDIAPAAGTWDCIKDWEIVNYRYKDQPDDADLNLGVIAQQVAESCPEVITVFEEAKDDQPEKLGVKEQQMYWMAIKALQEAQVRIEQLEQRLN